MSIFICDKCRTCCRVTESKDGDCGEYIKRKICIENIVKREEDRNE